MGSFQTHSVFDAARHGQQVRRFDFRNGPLAQPGKYIIFEPAVRSYLHDLPPIRLKTFHTTLEQTASKLSAPACASFSAFALPRDRCPHRAAVAQCHASRAPASKSHPDRPQRQAVFLCRRSGISPPYFAPSGADLKIKAALSNSLKGLSRRFAERTSTSVSGMGASHFPGLSYPPNMPQIGQLSGTASDHAGHYILRI